MKPHENPHYIMDDALTYAAYEMVNKRTNWWSHAMQPEAVPVPVPAPTQAEALRSGGWRVESTDAVTNQNLRVSYAAFMAAMSDRAMPTKPAVRWVSVLPERWTERASYAAAVAAVRARGCGVVEQMFRFRHMDLCDAAAYRRMCDAARCPCATHVERDAERPATRDADPPRLYEMTTAPCPALFDAWSATTADAYHEFLARTPSVIGQEF